MPDLTRNEVAMTKGYQYAPRVDFGRRLEPSGVLHGAGQSPEAFRAYFQATGLTKPVLYMTYVGLNSDMEAYFAALKRELAEYEPYQLMPQIGLLMTGVEKNPEDQQEHTPERHYEDSVASGLFDGQIELFCRGLAQLKRRVFVRIGFEFNGPWFGYAPEPYKAAWIRIVTAMRGHSLDDVAAVWCYCPLPGEREQPWGKDRDYSPYYPGDQYVDWWAIDLFSVEDFTCDNTVAFMWDAASSRFPVMIGESTPRWVGGVVGGEATWRRWFVPYFDFIRAYANVKAFCYIDWNWTNYPVWQDWGDARIEQNQTILEHYCAELAKPLYIHATGRDRQQE